MNELTTAVVIMCGCFILGRYEALPAVRETLSLIALTPPLHIATFRCADKIGCIASRTTHWRALSWMIPMRSNTISRHETTASRLNPILLYVACGIAWRANLCVRAGNSVYPSAELRGGAWPSCASVKWSASSLSCPLSTPVQRPGSSRQRAAGHVFPDVY